MNSADQNQPISTEENLNLDKNIRQLLLKALNDNMGFLHKASQQLKVSHRVITDLRYRHLIVYDSILNRYISLYDHYDMSRFVVLGHDINVIIRQRIREEQKRQKRRMRHQNNEPGQKLQTA